LTDHPEATPAVLDAFYRNMYGAGFVYCVDRAFVSTCATPCLVLAGNDEAHPLPISEELARLLPSCELVRGWKAGSALTSPRCRVSEFLHKDTPAGSRIGSSSHQRDSRGAGRRRAGFGALQG